MGLIGEMLQALSDLFYPKERRKQYDEAKTVPLTARLLAQALAGEGRRHAAVGYSKSGSLGNSTSTVSLFTLMGGADGHNVLPDFGIFGVSQGAGAMGLAGQASNAAVKAFSAKMVEDAVLEMLSLDNNEDASPFHQAVTDAFQSAVQSVSSQLPGSSFTMTAGLLYAEIFILGQFGNAPGYIVDHHHIEPITGIQGDGADNTGMSNIDEGLGDQLRKDFSKGFSIYSRPIPRDGYILLCTPGLPQVIPEYDIQRIMLELQEPQAICAGLIREAQKRKTEAEICAIAVHFPPDFGSWR